ncbi:hypothetical protein BDR07DRAFT_1477899 [Suillus spraguei]|nr:hypothetical protein BDR07DRAFT_1477899 [Suillus spraguei]
MTESHSLAMMLLQSMSMFSTGTQRMEAIVKRIKEQDAAMTLADVAGSPAPQSGSSPTPHRPPSLLWMVFSPGMTLTLLSLRSHMAAAPEGEVSESPKASTPLSPIPSPPAAFSSDTTEGFAGIRCTSSCSPGTYAPHPKPFDRTTSVSSVTGVRRPPPGLMPAGPKANMFLQA